MNDNPAWIDATERQPPDAWPRPCVVNDPITGPYWDKRRWEYGKWWVQGQLKEEPTNRVSFWMEVFPLPDGTMPRLPDQLT